MAYCDFCEVEHSSVSCQHPGRAKYDALLEKAMEESEAFHDYSLHAAKVIYLATDVVTAAWPTLSLPDWFINRLTALQREIFPGLAKPKA